MCRVANALAGEHPTRNLHAQRRIDAYKIRETPRLAGAVTAAEQARSFAESRGGTLVPLWIGPHDVAELVDEEQLIQRMRLGFRELTATLPAPQRFHSTLVGIPHATDQAEIMVLAPGALPTVPAFTVKVHAK